MATKWCRSKLVTVLCFLRLLWPPTTNSSTTGPKGWYRSRYSHKTTMGSPFIIRLDNMWSSFSWMGSGVESQLMTTCQLISMEISCVRIRVGVKCGSASSKRPTWNCMADMTSMGATRREICTCWLAGSPKSTAWSVERQTWTRTNCGRRCWQGSTIMTVWWRLARVSFQTKTMWVL